MILSNHTPIATNKTPYTLAFDFKVVILLEVGLPTIQTEAYDMGHNEEVLARDLNLADERGENMLIQMIDYQKQLTKTYHQKGQHIEFSVGNLIF